MAKKSVTQRIKVTPRGKLLRRRMGLGHFRAGKSEKVIRVKRAEKTISRSDMRKIRRSLFINA